MVIIVDVTALVILIAKLTITIRAGGSCEGGNPAGVYEFAAKVTTFATKTAWQRKKHGTLSYLLVR